MMKRIFSIILIILFTVTFLSTYTVASTPSIGSIISSAEDFEKEGKTGSEDTIDGTKLNNTSNLIYNSLLIAGVCVAVIIATVLGIQFITGSVEQKVRVKESLMPFTIGCIVLFGAFGIWRLIILILK